MDKEKRDMDNYLTFRNKLEELNNTKKEAILELYNMQKKYECQKKYKLFIYEYLKILNTISIS